jgi:hypothetical protein
VRRNFHSLGSEITQLSKGPGTARRTGRRGSWSASAGVSRDLVGPVEQLRVNAVAQDEAINTILAAATAFIASDGQCEAVIVVI